MLARTLIAVPLAALALAAGCATSTTTEGAGSGVNTMSFTVEGMACPNCAKDIAHELEELPGVESARIDFASKKATVHLDPENPATRAQLDAAVEKWRKEHFSAKEDPECLDPQKREELQKEQGIGG